MGITLLKNRKPRSLADKKKLREAVNKRRALKAPNLLKKRQRRTA